MNKVRKLDLAFLAVDPTIRVHYQCVQNAFANYDRISGNSPLELLKAVIQNDEMFDREDLRAKKRDMLNLLAECDGILQDSSSVASRNDAIPADEQVSGEDEVESTNFNQGFEHAEFEIIPKPSSRDWAGEMVWGRDINGHSTIAFLHSALRWVTSGASLDDLMKYYIMRGGADRKKQWILNPENSKYVCFDPNKSRRHQKHPDASMLKQQSILSQQSIPESTGAPKKRKRTGATKNRRRVRAVSEDQTTEDKLKSLLTTHATQHGIVEDSVIRGMLGVFKRIYEKGYTDSSREAYFNLGEGGI